MKLGRMRVHRLTVLVAVAVVACAGPAPEESVEPYRIAMDGRPVETELVATVAWPPGAFAGFVANTAFCEPRAYLISGDGAVIHVIDLEAGLAVDRIERQGEGPGEWLQAMTLATDCDAGVLYIVGYRHVVVLGLDRGEYRATIPRPASFEPNASRAGVFQGDLVVPGLWNMKGVYDFSDMQLGWTVPVERVLRSPSGPTGSPIAAPLEPECHGSGYICRKTHLERFEDSGAWYWAVSQGSSMRVEMLDSGSTRIRSIDVRSSRFTRDGGRVSRNATREESTNWGTTNSAVSDLFVWDDVLGVIHSLHANAMTSRDDVVQFDVFLNLLSLTGERLVSDIRLPDLPIGRSGEYIYFLDYGPAGRRTDFDQVDVRRLSLIDVRDSLLAQEDMR